LKKRFGRLPPVPPDTARPVQQVSTIANDDWVCNNASPVAVHCPADRPRVSSNDLTSLV
jgi:hypothetical protein